MLKLTLVKGHRTFRKFSCVVCVEPGFKILRVLDFGKVKRGKRFWVSRSHSDRIIDEMSE